MRTENRTVLIALLSLCLVWTCSAQAADKEPAAPDAATVEKVETSSSGGNWLDAWKPFDRVTNKPGFTVDYTYMSKLLDKGGAYYGEQSASLFSVDVDLFKTGFGFVVAHRMANAAGHVRRERLDYKVYYADALFKDAGRGIGR